jgi:transcriptional regulator with XRE-family HTH domain
METFAEWLQREMDRRGWDQAETARKAGVTRATINRALSETRRPGTRTCMGIAKAFGVDEDEVLSRAGHRSGKPTIDDMELSDWIAAGRKLTARERAELLEWAFSKIARRGR